MPTLCTILRNQTPAADLIYKSKHEIQTATSIKMERITSWKTTVTDTRLHIMHIYTSWKRMIADKLNNANLKH